MKRVDRKRCTIFIVAILCVAALITQSFYGIEVDAKAPNESGFITNTYSYAKTSTKNSINKSGYVYNDLYFDHSSLEPNHHLAVMSAILAHASSGTKDNQDYTGHSGNVKALLKDIGFQNIEVNADYTTRPTEDSFGVAAAMKKISLDEKDYTVLALTGRCSNYEKEWASNFNVGTNGDASGFSNAADKMLAFVKNYVTKHAIKGNVKVWITGYSRSAAVADIVGARLDDNPMYLNTKVDAENIYDYTFATPNSTTISEEKAASYKNIYNYYFDNDLVTMIPFASWGFRKYGQNIAMSPLSGTAKHKMLTFLSKSGNDDFYQSFTKADYEDPTTKIVTLNSDPDAFKLLQDNESLIQYNGFYFQEGDALPPLADNLKAFVEQKLQYVLDHLSIDRSAFVNTYEEPIAQFITFFNDLSDDEISDIADYFTKDESNGDLGKGKAAIYSLLTDLKSYHEDIIRGKGTSFLNICETGLVSNILVPIFERCSADDTTKAYFKSEAFTEPFVELASNLLYGYNGESFDTKANRIATRAFYTDLCVTLLGNASKFLANHQPETMVARLQSEDSYYTESGYELPFKVDATAGLDSKGKIAEDSTVGVIEGNSKELAVPNSSRTFKATAKTGYVFEKWVEQSSGGSFITVGNNTILKVDNINKAHHYFAVFKKKGSSSDNNSLPATGDHSDILLNAILLTSSLILMMNWIRLQSRKKL